MIALRCSEDGVGQMPSAWCHARRMEREAPTSHNVNLGEPCFSSELLKSCKQLVELRQQRKKEAGFTSRCAQACACDLRCLRGLSLSHYDPPTLSQLTMETMSWGRMALVMAVKPTTARGKQ